MPEDSSVAMDTSISDEDRLNSGIHLPEAMKVIINKSGREVSGKATEVANDAYMGFLILRHLKIRDLRTKVNQ